MAQNNGMTAEIRQLLAQGCNRRQIYAALDQRYSRKGIMRAICALGVHLPKEPKGTYAPEYAPAPAPRRGPAGPALRDGLVEFAPGHFMRPEWASRLGYL